MKRFLSRLSLVVPLVVVLVIGTVQPGHATLIYTLNVGNAALSSYGVPFGTVEVTRLTATTGVLKFIANPAVVGGFRYAFGDGGMAGFNLANQANVTSALASFTDSPAPGAAGPISFGGAGSEDGFGTFNRTYNDFDGFSHTVSDVTFSLTRGAGSWASDADILAPNALGNSVAVHVFVADASWNNTGVTGFATAGSVVPEPTTILALGSGLVLLGAARKRNQKR